MERAAGNPLFLEQLLCHVEDNARALSVPGSVQSLVQARTDRLDLADKQALQAASVAASASRSGETLGFILDRPDYTPESLIAHRLVRPQGEGILVLARLVPDAIYDTLLKRRRRALHRRAAEWFAERTPCFTPSTSIAPMIRRHRGLSQRGAVAGRRVPPRGGVTTCRAGPSACCRARGPLRACLPSRRPLVRVGAIAAAEAAYRKALNAAESCAEQCRGWIGLATVKRVTDDLEGAFADLDRAEAKADEQD